MEEGDIDNDLGPHSLLFSEVIRYLSFDSVAKETPCCVCSDSSNDHVKEMIRDYVVLQFHVEVQVVICVCSRELDLLFEVTEV